MTDMKILICIVMILFAQAVAGPSSVSDFVDEQMNGHINNLPILQFKHKLPKYTQMPVMTTFHAQTPLEIQVPSPMEIVNRQPDPEKYFSGSVLKKTRTNRRDEQGRTINSGGTIIVSNNNGNVKQFKSGNAPNIEDEFVFPPMMIPDMPNFDSLGSLNLEFEPMLFDPIQIPPIDVDAIKTYVPKEGEHFIGTSSKVFSSTRTVNGKTESESGGKKYVNIDGDVNEEDIGVKEQDKD